MNTRIEENENNQLTEASSLKIEGQKKSPAQFGDNMPPQEPAPQHEPMSASRFFQRSATVAKEAVYEIYDTTQRIKNDRQLFNDIDNEIQKGIRNSGSVAKEFFRGIGEIGSMFFSKLKEGITEGYQELRTGKFVNSQESENGEENKEELEAEMRDQGRHSGEGLRLKANAEVPQLPRLDEEHFVIASPAKGVELGLNQVSGSPENFVISGGSSSSVTPEMPSNVPEAPDNFVFSGNSPQQGVEEIPTNIPENSENVENTGKAEIVEENSPLKEAEDVPINIPENEVNAENADVAEEESPAKESNEEEPNETTEKPEQNN